MEHGHGTWTWNMDMEHGTWNMEHGTWAWAWAWNMEHGTWNMEHGHGTWNMDMEHGTWTWHMGYLPRQARRGACGHPVHQLQPRPHLAARQLRSWHRASLPAGRRSRGRSSSSRSRSRAAHAHPAGQLGGGGRRRLYAGQPALQLCLPGRLAPKGDHAHLLPVAVELRAVPPARLSQEPNLHPHPHPHPNPNPKP
jgi:hypothetical protein